jgi:hypothetical protein
LKKKKRPRSFSEVRNLHHWLQVGVSEVRNLSHVSSYTHQENILTISICVHLKFFPFFDVSLVFLGKTCGPHFLSIDSGLDWTFISIKHISGETVRACGDIFRACRLPWYFSLYGYEHWFLV